MNLADHKTMAETLRAHVIDAKGKCDPWLRAAAMNRATGGDPLLEPYEALVSQVNEAAVRVTDEQVASVRKAAGSDKAAFEIIMAASIGAGLLRFDQAVRVIEENIHASE